MVKTKAGQEDLLVSEVPAAFRQRWKADIDLRKIGESDLEFFLRSHEEKVSVYADPTGQARLESPRRSALQLARRCMMVTASMSTGLLRSFHFNFLGFCVLRLSFSS